MEVIRHTALENLKKWLAKNGIKEAKVIYPLDKLLFYVGMTRYPLVLSHFFVGSAILSGWMIVGMNGYFGLLSLWLGHLPNISLKNFLVCQGILACFGPLTMLGTRMTLRKFKIPSREFFESSDV